MLIFSWPVGTFSIPIFPGLRNHVAGSSWIRAFEPMCAWKNCGADPPVRGRPTGRPARCGEIDPVGEERVPGGPAQTESQTEGPPHDSRLFLSDCFQLFFQQLFPIQ